MPLKIHILLCAVKSNPRGSSRSFTYRFACCWVKAKRRACSTQSNNLSAGGVCQVSRSQGGGRRGVRGSCSAACTPAAPADQFSSAGTLLLLIHNPISPVHNYTAVELHRPLHIAWYIMHTIHYCGQCLPQSLVHTHEQCLFALLQSAHRERSHLQEETLELKSELAEVRASAAAAEAAAAAELRAVKKKHEAAMQVCCNLYFFAHRLHEQELPYRFYCFWQMADFTLQTMHWRHHM